MNADETRNGGVVVPFMPEAETPQVELLTQRIADAIAAADASELERAAHRMKGTLQALAATRASELASTLERFGREADLADAGATLTGLRQELDRLHPALERWIRRAA